MAQLQHTVAIELIADSLRDKTSDLIKIEDLKTVLNEDLVEKLTDNGKNIVTTGLNPDAINEIKTEIQRVLETNYLETLNRGKLALKQRNDPNQVVQNAQAYFKSSLEKTQCKKNLFAFFLEKLAGYGQLFGEEDKPLLRNAFDQYLDKTAEEYSHSLRDLKSIESVKARIQLHDKNLKSNSNGSMSAQPLTINNLNEGTKVEPVVGYKINKDNLREQLQYALSNLKPGEKICIEASRPDRDDIVKRIAETGFQYRNPLLALLLLLFIQLQMIKKDDVTRTMQAVKDLAKKHDLIIDPKDINLKLSVVGADGKRQTILEGPLPEPLVQDLNQSIAKINAQRVPKPDFSNKKQNEEVNNSPRFRA